MAHALLFCLWFLSENTMDPHHQRLRFAQSLMHAGRSILELSWDEAPGLSLNRGHDVVLVTDAWDLSRDPHPLLDAAVRHLNRDGALLLAVAHRPFGNRWQETEPQPSFGALHLRTLLEARFGEVELWHQSRDSAYCVVPGVPDDASCYVAVARAPRVASPAVVASIVIPVFNKCELTHACLLALQKQTPPQGVPFEVIVVDNASWDKTSELLHRFQEHPELNLRVVRNASNLGFAKASNQGALVARGSVVVFRRFTRAGSRRWSTNCSSRPIPAASALDCCFPTGPFSTPALRSAAHRSRTTFTLENQPTTRWSWSGVRSLS
jgi:hypothetical protein